MSDEKVMIVDDDKEFLEELSESLKLSGYKIIAVNDPALALETAVGKKPDMILLDLKMPGKSGFCLADELKKSPALAEIPIVVMSGYFKESHSGFFDIYGINDYISKPFSPAQVVAKISEVLQKSRIRTG